MLSRRSAWGLTAVWAFLIFVFSSIPGGAFPSAQLFTTADKVAHLGIYAVFAALAFAALRKTWNVGTRSSVLAATALALCYGITDEFHQRFVPGRSADVFDVAADGLGALLGTLAAAWASLRRGS